MSNSAPENDAPFTQEEVDAAEAAEQAALSDSQNQYLVRRIVVLRTQLNRLQSQLEEVSRRLGEKQEEQSDSL